MTKPSIKTAAVIGTGTMGPGIALVLARFGVQVRLHDIDPIQLEKAKETLGRNLQLLQSEEIITAAEVEAIHARIRPVDDLTAAVQGVDLAIEVVPEVLEIKKQVFAHMDELCPADAILASNTSGLSITAMAGATRRPRMVVGMHWWNPPIIIPVIEIVRGSETHDDTVAAVDALIRRIKKVPVLVNKDVPGFLGNRLQYALMREAIALWEEGVASAEDIDTMIRSGIGFKFPVMGPLETIDMAGLDIFHKVSGYLYADLNRDSTPPAAIARRVAENRLGLKTGKGFYDYAGQDIPALMGGRIKKLIRLLKELGYE